MKYISKIILFVIIFFVYINAHALNHNYCNLKDNQVIRVKVIFDCDCEIELKELYYCYGCSSSINQINLPFPKKEGYKFLGWYIEGEENLYRGSVDKAILNKYVETNNLDCTSDNSYVVLKAHFKLNSKKDMNNYLKIINYESNGGTIIEPTYIYPNVNKKIDMPIPIKKGYVFMGWYSDSNLIGKVNFNKILNNQVNFIEHEYIESNNIKFVGKIYAKWISTKEIIEQITLFYKNQVIELGNIISK